MDLPDHLTYVCLILYRTMPFGYASVLLEPHHAPVLSVEANEPPLNLRRQKLSLQYALRLSTNYQNPAYNVVFSAKFGRFFRTNPIRFLHLAFVYLIFMQSDSERNLLHNQPP